MCTCYKKFQFEQSFVIKHGIIFWITGNSNIAHMLQVEWPCHYTCNMLYGQNELRGLDYIDFEKHFHSFRFTTNLLIYFCRSKRLLISNNTFLKCFLLLYSMSGATKRCQLDGCELIELEQTKSCTTYDSTTIW